MVVNAATKSNRKKGKKTVRGREMVDVFRGTGVLTPGGGTEDPFEVHGSMDGLVNVGAGDAGEGTGAAGAEAATSDADSEITTTEDRPAQRQDFSARRTSDGMYFQFSSPLRFVHPTLCITLAELNGALRLYVPCLTGPRVYALRPPEWGRVHTSAYCGVDLPLIRFPLFSLAPSLLKITR